MSSVKKPAAPVQHTYRLTEVDKFQIQVLQADEKAEKDPVKKNNILACINYIKGHGIPKEDSHVLYAHNSKAVQELKMEYRKKIGSNGPLHAVRSKLCVVVSCALELLYGRTLMKLR